MNPASSTSISLPQGVRPGGRRQQWGAVLLLAATLCLPATVSAQQGSSGRVVGQVTATDAHLAAPGVQVRVQGEISGTQTDRDGRFVLENVAPGTRTLEIVHEGTVNESVEVTVRPGRTSYVEAHSQVAMQPRGEIDRLLDLLVERGVITAEEVAALRAAVQDDIRPLPGQALGYEPTLPIRDDRVRVQVLPLGIETWDGQSRFRIRGRIQADFARQFWGDEVQNVARQSHPFPEYGLILRRVRLGAAGISRGNWEWQLEADFAENEVDLANVYLARLFDHGRLAAGYFKEPFGMEYATSSRYITFMERSAASDAYKVNREPGIMYETLFPQAYLGFGLFGNGIDYDREVREGWALNARGSFAPYLVGTDYVHLGAGINRRHNGYDLDSEEWLDVRLRTREGTRAIDARLIGRDDLVGVETFTRMNTEFAAGFGPWWVQGEYLRVNINLDTEAVQDALGNNATDASSLRQHGWYAQTGFFLTGESRNYRAFSGDFGPQFPFRNLGEEGGIGALELALRYSQANSLEHTRPGRGQKLDHYTLGLNWYMSPEIVLKANLMYLEGERDTFQDGGWLFGMRVQYVF